MVVAMSKQPLIDQLDDVISRIVADPDVQLSPIDASLIELGRIARDLRELPSPDFKARLRADIERKASMSTKAVVFRPGFRTVTPYLLPPNAEFIDFLKNVFGAVQTERTDTSPTSFHAEMRIGDSMLMMGGGSGRSMPAALQVYLPNAVEVYERALAAGATSLNPIIEDHGDRFGCVQDPVGNHWYISTRLGGHYIPDNLHTITTWFHPAGSAKFIDFLKQAFSAEELERYDSPKGVVKHAKIKIGDSVLALSEPHDWWQPMTTMTYLYVPDADAVYKQAIRAGATSIHPPADQPYGDRNGGVTDAWGNQWFMATPL
jgi:PhnB protein